MSLHPSKKQVCNALVKELEEKIEDAVLSNELMATIRNADFIPTNDRYTYIDIINGITENEKKAVIKLDVIEKGIECGYKPKKYLVTKISADEDYQRYMDIVSKHKKDPRIKGNR